MLGPNVGSSNCSPIPRTNQGSRFRYFLGFFGFGDFLDFWAKNGPKRAREGFQWVRGSIPLHLDKVSAQMGPFGAHSGPFLFFNFPKTPNSSNSTIPNEVLGPWDPYGAWIQTGLGAIWAQNGIFRQWKTKMCPNGPNMGPFGLKLCPNEAECLPGPYGAPPGP